MCCLVSEAFSKCWDMADHVTVTANEVPARQFKHTIVDELSAVTEEKYTEKGEIEYQENA